MKLPTRIDRLPCLGALFMAAAALASARPAAVEAAGSYEYANQFGNSGDAGQLYDPTGAAVSGGDVFVADYGNGRIAEFTTQGATSAPSAPCS